MSENRNFEIKENQDGINNNTIALDSRMSKILRISHILFSFKGRISRKIYWIALIGIVLFFLSVVSLLSFLFEFCGLTSETRMIIGVFGFICPLMIVALQVKRLHDFSMSGWVVLAILACSFMTYYMSHHFLRDTFPILENTANFLLWFSLIVIGIIPSKSSTNKYGIN